MKTSRKLLSLLLIMLLIFSMMPSQAVAAAAEEAVSSAAETEQQAVLEQAGEVKAETDDTSPGKGSGESVEQPEKGAESQSAPEQGQNERSLGGQQKASPSNSDDEKSENSAGKKKQSAVVPRSSLQLRADELPSGTVSGDWIWKVTGEEGNYTLTFEYTGTAATPPTFAVPANFVANISTQLGDLQSQIKKVVVPEGCTAINTRAFQNLKGLEEVEIGSTVQTIGTVAFGDNNSSNAGIRDTKLKKVTFKTGADRKSKLTRIEAGAFTGCSALSSVNLEDTQVYYLGQEVFRSTKLENVYLPDTMAKNNSAYLGNYAFADNSNLKSASLPALFYYSTAGANLFSNCTKLEDVDFRTVDGANARSTAATALPNYTFQNCTNLKHVDLSAWEKSNYSSSYTYFQIDYNTFIGTSLNNLEELILPKKEIRIAANTFLMTNSSPYQGKTGIKSFDQFVNHEYITTIGDRAFYGTRLEEGPTSDMTRLTSIGMEAFKNCDNMESLVIPAKVTTIGSAAFKNCDNLESVRIEATSLTTLNTANFFDGDDNLKEVTISAQTKKLNGNMLAAIPDFTDTFFEGENVIEITKATANRGTRPLKGMDGKYYVDGQGVLYKLNEETGKASLAYVPPEITSYTVPEKITTPDGTEFEVSAIDAYALNLADDLTAITFEKPENIYLKPQAFSGWSKSTDNMGKTVNGKEAIDPDDGWTRYSSVCDFPIKDEDGKLVPVIKDTQKNADGDDVLKIVIVVNKKSPSEDNTYDYKTGQKASYMIAISNEDNTVLDKVVRIYFSYSDAGYNMGSFTEGIKPIEANGKTYPCKVVRTDNPNIYYYEITGIDPGETVAIDNDIFYPSPGTGGGEVKIWTHTITKEQAAVLDGDVINPDNYMEFDWDTDPVEYKLTKANSTVYDSQNVKQQSPIIKSNTNGDAFVSSLAWTIKESNVGSAPTTEGLDYIKWVNYEDVITLPDELAWRDGLIDAINAGKWTVEDTTTYYYTNNSTLNCKAIAVTVNGTKYYLAYLANPTGYGRDYIDNLKVRVTDDGKVKFTWKVSNTSLSGASATSEYRVHTFYLRVGDNVLKADLDKVNDLMEANPGVDLKTLLKIHNDTDEIRHYSYSPNQTAASSVDSPVDAKYDVDIRKDWQQDSDREIEGGKDDFFNISINNTGILRLNTWGKPVTDGEGNTTYNGQIIHDSLHKNMYIMPNNIENMFNAVVTAGSGTNSQRVPIGDWLKIMITKASLFTEGQYQPVDGTNQNNKYTTGSNSDIYASADNGARVYQLASMVLQKNTDGKIAVKLTGDSKTANNRTYIISADGDYPSIEAFFTAIGYMPTVDTIYTVDYNIPADTTFTLQPGQKITFPIRSTYKTTAMRATVDTRNGLNNSTSNSSSNPNRTDNNATVSLKAGEKNISETVYPYYISSGSKFRRYHYWQRDLYLSKTGYIQGQSSSISTSTIIEDGTVIDNRLYSYNKSERAYDHMQINDYSDGPQVVLVPKEQNQGLTGPDGNEPEVYESNGVIYYLLNKIGTYENVTIGSTTGKDGTQTLKADITVTETKSGNKRTSLNTLIKWKPFNNWGATTAANYIYYKVLVSGEKAGFTSASNPGEVERYTLNNKAWLGDHQGHRLWDTYGMYLQVYSFNKKILTDDGQLVTFSRLKQSAKVTYQIEINSTSDSPTILSGSRIKDTLPANYGVFAWTKGSNVKNLRYIGSEGVTITYGSGDSAVDIPADGSASSTDDYWSIVNNTPSSGYQQIQWDNSFNVHFPERGTLKILVDLEFPERPENGASVWDQYVAANAGKTLENRFYLDSRSSYVQHLLESEGKAVLYKGVYDTGMTTHHPDYTSTEYGKYYSNNTRLLYENGTGSVAFSNTDLKASTITYYTVLYNGSYDRLYLSELQDQLPRGFTFNSMCNTYLEKNQNVSYKYINASTSNSSYRNYTSTGTSYLTSNNYIGYTAPNGRYTNEAFSDGSASYPLVTIDKSADQYDNNTVKYVNARVVASTQNGSDGRQHITFKLNDEIYKGGSNILKYDSEVGKYYLNPGECIRFGYNVLIDKYANTDDLATNTITMPYYDYYGTGFILDKPGEDGKGGAIQKARAVSGITPNDGTCDMMTADEVSSQYGINTGRYSDSQYSTLEGGNYMVSSVTVERASITPGLNKTIGGLTGKLAAPASDTAIEGSRGSAGSSALYGTAYKGGAKSSDVVNWKLRVFNETLGKNENASGMMTNYKVVDTVDAPYKFTGQVFYNMYKSGTANGTKVTTSSQYLFTIGSRKTTDTSVRFSSGDSLSASGYRNVRIGDAADNSDDDWFEFGSGTKAGKVKLEKDADGNEVLTIELTGTAYSIPAGYWADFCLHTMYPTNPDDNSTVIVVSDTKYNNALLYPDQGYDPTKVAQGRARTKQEYNDEGELVTVNDGIQSGVSITITQGYTTSSWKKITEIGNTSNTAQSDLPENCISLSEKSKNVRYDMYVIGPQAMMSKIVIIDDLPHEGDHSAFVEKDLRYSEFSVGFLEDDLDLKVYIAKKTGQNNGVNTYGADTLLDPSKYDAYVSTKTEYTNDEDWEGNGEGWTKLSDLSDEEITDVLKEARSIRIVIKDPAAWIPGNDSNYLMSAECRLRVSFNARINDSEAKPGEIAWNSFGYKYEVPKIQSENEEERYGISLEAQPLNVGLKYPCAPILKKTLTEEITVSEDVEDPETGETTSQEVKKVVDHEAQQDLYFGIIIYEGEPIEALNNAANMGNDQIHANLLTKKYVYLPYEIKEGESEKELGLWTIDHCSTYDPGTDTFIEAEDAEGNKIPWQWINGKKYSIIELGTGSYNFGLNKISIGDNEFSSNNVVFANSTDTKIQLIADNRYQPEYIDLTGTKTWDDDNDKAKKRPESITIRLFADGKQTDSQTVKADDDGSWSFKFEHLLKEKEDGTKITYTVKEDVVSFYDTELEREESEDGSVSYSIINTLNYGEVSVKKEWKDRDNVANIRPESIIVNLLSAEWKQKTDEQGEPVLDEGGKPVYEAPSDEDFQKIDTATIAPDEDGNWEHVFKDLPDHTDKGVKIEYKVTEDKVDYYDTDIEREGETVYKITNTLNYMEVTGTKVWDDENDAAGLRPKEIKVYLLANGERMEGKEIRLPQKDEDGNESWDFKFDQLMMADSSGNMIEYTVEEDRAPHYKEPVVEDVTPEDDKINKEFRITNSIELTEVSVEKYWDDYDDSAGLRPFEITVHLLADGQEADTVKVTAQQDWKHTFTSLPKLDANWNEIKYTVTEDLVADYETGIAPDGEGKFIITNRCLYVDLLLTKKMSERFDSDAGKNSTVAFHVEGKDKDGNVVYENTVGIAFNDQTGASETKVLKKVPRDAEITVTEVYSGPYTPKQVKITRQEVEQYTGQYSGYRGKTVWLFEFENEIGDEPTGDNGGIVNNYSDSGNGVRFKGGEE